MESLLSMETRPDGHEATDKTRYYQLRTFRLVDVYKVVKAASKSECHKLAIKLHEWQGPFRAMTRKS